MHHLPCCKKRHQRGKAHEENPEGDAKNIANQTHHDPDSNGGITARMEIKIPREKYSNLKN